MVFFNFFEGWGLIHLHNSFFRETLERGKGREGKEENSFPWWRGGCCCCFSWFYSTAEWVKLHFCCVGRTGFREKGWAFYLPRPLWKSGPWVWRLGPSPGSPLPKSHKQEYSRSYSCKQKLGWFFWLCWWGVGNKGEENIKNKNPNWTVERWCL